MQWTQMSSSSSFQSSHSSPTSMSPLPQSSPSVVPIVSSTDEVISLDADVPLADIDATVVISLVEIVAIDVAPLLSPLPLSLPPPLRFDPPASPHARINHDTTKATRPGVTRTS